MKLALPNTMSRTALQSVDGNIADSLYHRDTIIPSFNAAFGYFHIAGEANMNTISVGAGSWCTELKQSKSNVCRVSDKYVKAFRVHGLDVLYDSIVDLVEINALHYQTYKAQKLLNFIIKLMLHFKSYVT